MTLVSVYFLIFLGIVTLIYYVVPRNTQWGVLLLASLVFYFLCAKGFLCLLIIDAFIAFFFSVYLEKKKSKVMLVLELVILIGILILLKYSSWFGGSCERLLSKLYLGGTESYIVPLGISYILVYSIGYTLDVFRDNIPAEKNFLKVLGFLAFFPAITQGPISRYNDLQPQIEAGHKFSYENLTSGIVRMIWGFFKKLVIANRLAAMMSTLTNNWTESSYSGWFVVVAFSIAALELYMDFSGCMDIVIGTAEILGIRLEENFDHPFMADSCSDFWRRWHITLGAWLRDYVMYSFTMSALAKKLNKNLKKKLDRKTAGKVVNIIGVILVWICFSLWHGIGGNFAVGGAFYGIWIVLGIALEKTIKKFDEKFRPLVESKIWHFFRIIRTIAMFSVGGYLMITPSLQQGTDYFLSIFQSPAGSFLVNENGKGTFSLLNISILGLDIYDFIILMIAIAIWGIVASLDRKKDVRKRLSGMNVVGRWTILFGLIIAIVVFGIYGKGLDAGSFIYQGF